MPLSNQDSPTETNLTNLLGKACLLGQKIEQAWPPAAWASLHVVLAVSGGADSVAMLRLFDTLKKKVGGPGKLYVAHLNHQLRGQESDEDQRFLEKLCALHTLPLTTAKIDVSQVAKEQGLSLEAAAREVRYDFLQQTTHQLGARFLVTAHTQNDQVETILHRLVRGTGVGGLRGIRPTRPLDQVTSLVRPMLQITRHEIETYLAEIRQPYRTDSSNQNMQFTRNRLRKRLLPQLRQEYNTEVDQALLRLSQQATAHQELLETLVQPLFTQTVQIFFSAASSSTLPFSVSEPSVSSPLPSSASTSNALKITIQTGPLSETGLLALGELCKQAWQQANWPEQAMGYAQWGLLAKTIRSTTLKNSDPLCKSPILTLPGKIRVQPTAGQVVLTREPT